jgi:hypothetical protein
MEPIPATIAASGSVSDDVNLGGRVLVGIEMPTAWTAASITFQASFDGTNFFDVYDGAGSEVSGTAGASQFITMNPATLYGIKVIRVRSGTSAAAVNQAAERVINLIAGDPNSY